MKLDEYSEIIANSDGCEVMKNSSGYKVILRAVLKSQILSLIQQLSADGDEESVILTANVSDGTLSHLGSESGRSFLSDHEDIKLQFLNYCLKRYYSPDSSDDELTSGHSTCNNVEVGTDVGISNPKLSQEAEGYQSKDAETVTEASTEDEVLSRFSDADEPIQKEGYKPSMHACPKIKALSQMSKWRPFISNADRRETAEVASEKYVNNAKCTGSRNAAHPISLEKVSQEAEEAEAAEISSKHSLDFRSKRSISKTKKENMSQHVESKQASAVHMPFVNNFLRGVEVEKESIVKSDCKQNINNTGQFSDIHSSNKTKNRKGNESICQDDSIKQSVKKANCEKNIFNSVNCNSLFSETNKRQYDFFTAEGTTDNVQNNRADQLNANQEMGNEQLDAQATIRNKRHKPSLHKSSSVHGSNMQSQRQMEEQHDSNSIGSCMSDTSFENVGSDEASHYNRYVDETGPELSRENKRSSEDKISLCIKQERCDEETADIPDRKKWSSLKYPGTYRKYINYQLTSLRNCQNNAKEASAFAGPNKVSRSSETYSMSEPESTKLQSFGVHVERKTDDSNLLQPPTNLSPCYTSNGSIAHANGAHISAQSSPSSSSRYSTSPEFHLTSELTTLALDDSTADTKTISLQSYDVSLTNKQPEEFNKAFTAKPVTVIKQENEYDQLTDSAFEDTNTSTLDTGEIGFDPDKPIVISDGSDIDFIVLSHDNSEVEIEEQGVSDLQCYICGEVQKNPRALKLHTSLHTRVSSNRCLQCKKSFPNKISIIRHMKISHKKSSFTCSICKASFRFRSKLKMHTSDCHFGATHENSAEPLLEEDTLSAVSGTCYNPINQESNMKYRTGKIMGQKKLFQCKICGKIYRRKKCLKTHLFNCHGIDRLSKAFVYYGKS